MEAIPRASPSASEGGLTVETSASVSTPTASAQEALASPSTADTPAAPVAKPVLRGRLYEVASAKAGQRSHVFEGRWAMSELDALWSEFRYVINTPNNTTELPPPGIVPINPGLPSAADHAVLGAQMSGHFFMANVADPSQPPVKIADTARVRIGGNIATDAPLPMQLADGSIAPVGSLVAVAGEGAVGGSKYMLVGAYHPPSGTTWVRKIFVPKSAVKPPQKPRTPADGVTMPRPMVPATARAKSTASVDPIVETPREPRQKKTPRALEEHTGPGLSRLSKLPTDLYKCHQLLTAVKKDRSNAFFFLTPVNPERDKAFNYFDVIKTPMDFGTIQTNLEGNKYASHEEFARDVRLVFSNAMAYNPPVHPVYKAAEALRDEFEKLYERFKETRVQEAEEAARRAAEDDERRARGEIVDGDKAKGKKAKGAKPSVKRDRQSISGGDDGFGDYDEGTDEGSDDTERRSGGPSAKKPRKGANASSGGAVALESENEYLRREMLELKRQLSRLAESTSRIAELQAKTIVQGAPVQPTAFQSETIQPYTVPAMGKKGGAPPKKVVETKPKGQGRGRPAAAAPAPAPAPVRQTSASSGHMMPAALPLTLSEKEDLTRFAEMLQAHQTTELYRIIEERLPVGAAGAAEVDIDIDELDTATLREMQRYVFRCVNRPLPPSAAEYFRGVGGAQMRPAPPVAAPRPAPTPAPMAPTMARPDNLQSTLDRAPYLQKNMAALAGSGPGYGAVGSGAGLSSAPRPSPPLSSAFGSANRAVAAADSEDEDPPPPPPR